MTFSPVSQNTVRNVQTRIREIDMALHPSIKSTLGDVRTFTYSTLAGCCDFLDSIQKGGYSNEVESFAKKIVAPTVEKCFEEIEKYLFKINDEDLKLILANKLREIQQYDNPGFKCDLSPELIKKLSDVIKIGRFDFYKLKEADQKYYGGVVKIDKESFDKAAALMEEAGYKEEGDMIGSSLDVGPHITTVFARELSQNYDHIINVHQNFVSETPNASFKPVFINYGYPQSGILSKAVALMVDSPEIDTYRATCGLEKLEGNGSGGKPPQTHISIFSKVVKPLQELENKKVTIYQFIDKPTFYLSKLNQVFRSAAL